MGAWPAVFLFLATFLNLYSQSSLGAALAISISFSICIGLIGGTVTVLSGLCFTRIIFRKERVD